MFIPKIAKERRIGFKISHMSLFFVVANIFVCERGRKRAKECVSSVKSREYLVYKGILGNSEDLGSDAE